MTQEERMTALYKKMAAEQDRYRDWLMGQAPEEILNHAYEFTVRENIVMTIEDMELTAEQAEALLASPFPLTDICKDVEKIETGYMDIIRDTIKERAEKERRQRPETEENRNLKENFQNRMMLFGKLIATP